MKPSHEAHQTKMPFITEHWLDVRELLRFTGVTTDDLDEIVRQTQPWVRGDHFSPEKAIDVSDEQSRLALAVFNRIGMVGEVVPPSGVYDRILILGGMHNSNIDRLAFTDKLITSGTLILPKNAKIVLLGGNRTVGDDEAPVLDISTETDSLRLAALQLGELSLKQMHLRVGLVPKSHAIVQRYIYGGELSPVEVINASPVERGSGLPRHTTKSTVAEWLRTDDLEDGSKVLFVSSNPYILRTLNDAICVTEEFGRNLNMVGCGPAASESMLLRRCYGELARLLYQHIH